jgi:hypothetical protein
MTGGAVSTFSCLHSSPLSSSLSLSICFFGELDRDPSPDSDLEADEPVDEGGGRFAARGVRSGSMRRRRFGVVPSIESEVGGLGSAAFRFEVLERASDGRYSLGRESSQDATRCSSMVGVDEMTLTLFDDGDSRSLLQVDCRGIGFEGSPSRSCRAPAVVEN